MRDRLSIEEYRDELLGLVTRITDVETVSLGRADGRTLAAPVTAAVFMTERRVIVVDKAFLLLLLLALLVYKSGWIQVTEWDKGTVPLSHFRQ